MRPRHCAYLHTHGSPLQIYPWSQCLQIWVAGEQQKAWFSQFWQFFTIAFCATCILLFQKCNALKIKNEYKNVDLKKKAFRDRGFICRFKCKATGCRILPPQMAPQRLVLGESRLWIDLASEEFCMCPPHFHSRISNYIPPSLHFHI